MASVCAEANRTIWVRDVRDYSAASSLQTDGFSISAASFAEERCVLNRKFSDFNMFAFGPVAVVQLKSRCVILSVFSWCLILSSCFIFLCHPVWTKSLFFYTIKVLKALSVSSSQAMCETKRQEYLCFVFLPPISAKTAEVKGEKSQISLFPFN